MKLAKRCIKKTAVMLRGAALMCVLSSGAAVYAQSSASTRNGDSAPQFGCAASAGRLESRGRSRMAQTGVALTLKRAIELALQNSADLQLANIQSRLANHSAMITKAEFLPNLYAGSGAGYTYGIPETPGGRAPAIFNVSYTQQILNEPLRGQAKELQEQARSQTIVLQDVRNSVIVRTAMAYLELGRCDTRWNCCARSRKARTRFWRSRGAGKEKDSSCRWKSRKAQLTKAQVLQRILQLEGRQDELEVFLRSQIGFAAEQPVEIMPEDLPGEAEQEGANLVAMAMQNNTGLQLAESDVRAKEFRLKGEKRGYFPTLELVSVYSLLGKFNNYDQFFRTFQRNNFNAGVQVQVPIFSARTKANIGLAEVNLDAAKATLSNKKVGFERRSAAENTRRTRKRCGQRSGAFGTTTGAAGRGGVSIAIRGRQIKSSRSGTGATDGKRTVDGVPGCKFRAAAGATGTVARGGAARQGVAVTA